MLLHRLLYAFSLQELLRHNLLSASDECDLSKHYKLGTHVKTQRKQMIKNLGQRYPINTTLNSSELL